jgi:hypothetical protein
VAALAGEQDLILAELVGQLLDVELTAHGEFWECAGGCVHPVRSVVEYCVNNSAAAVPATGVVFCVLSSVGASTISAIGCWLAWYVSNELKLVR